MARKRARFLVASVDWSNLCRRAARVRDGWQLFDARLPVNTHHWFAYRDEAAGEPFWWIIEGRSGLAVGRGFTIDAAVRSFVSHEARMMTWCGLAANAIDVTMLPPYREAAE